MKRVAGRRVVPFEALTDWRDVLSGLCVRLEDRRLPRESESELLPNYAASLRTFAREVNLFCQQIGAEMIDVPHDINCPADYRLAYAKMQAHLCTLARRRTRT